MSPDRPPEPCDRVVNEPPERVPLAVPASSGEGRNHPGPREDAGDEFTLQPLDPDVTLTRKLIREVELPPCGDPDRPAPDRFQFRLKHALITMALAALGLALTSGLRQDVAAGVIGFCLALGLLPVLNLGKHYPLLSLGWGVLLAVYLILIVAALAFG
jgi:hypothetical protein